MTTVTNLKNPVNKWRCGATPISYYYFIRLMGRKASHVALECALQSHPNMIPFNQCHRVQGILPQDEGRLPQFKGSTFTGSWKSFSSPKISSAFLVVIAIVSNGIVIYVWMMKTVLLDVKSTNTIV
ncbi:Pyrophosphate--fructose 6-phosphate 1-phosphotransferase subunit alpha [Zea mays]|uniref:Pyrophosphate--fructose 6-phosphate 1-phosphotransferase subunit alpha n=1 Tax=Zea mays TaxID=4577 RepID=A0A3L6EDF3_MAIZE|nr:Pyrophosphate--fructose 6-phosphate 1-phosphotransferase subunit alpha [Zea mays]